MVAVAPICRHSLSLRGKLVSRRGTPNRCGAPNRWRTPKSRADSRFNSLPFNDMHHCVTSRKHATPLLSCAYVTAYEKYGGWWVPLTIFFRSTQGSTCMFSVSCTLFCTYETRNRLVFMQFRTLVPKHG